jgi:hypothetical protein
MNAAQEVGGGVDEAGCGDGPCCHATDQRIARTQLLPVLTVERGPGLATAIEWHLHTQGHVLWEN